MMQLNPNSDEAKQDCEEKLKFATKKEASAAAVVAEHQHGTKLKVYACTGCGWWHLSSR